MMFKKLNISALLLLSIFTGNTQAQVCHNLYPYAQGVVFDNNGHDLAGFIKSNKNEVAYRGAKIEKLSNGHWGYMQIKNAPAPSINIDPVSPDKKVDLNYSEIINATLALFYDKDEVSATWWARQCNNSNGPMFYKKVDNSDRPGTDNVRYEVLMSAMRTKQFTLIEFNDSTYNQRDYNQLVNNYILTENGTIKKEQDYKLIIDFYNDFLTKFTYIEDPLLQNKSFITCLTANGTKYLAYFNVVNSKLAGNLQIADIQYEVDKDTLVDNVVKNLKGKDIIVYGDDIFGMEKTFLRYAHNHPALNFIRRTSKEKESFNKAK